MKRKSLIFSLILFVVFIALSSLGCDGVFGAEGTVYEWVDAPFGSKGEIYIDTDPPTNRVAVPIADATVLLDIYYEDVSSDNMGEFDAFSVVAPGRYMMDIKIEKEGYLTVSGEFQHEGDSPTHRIIIFLVRK